MVLPDWLTSSTRRLAIVLAAHVAVLGTMTVLAAGTDMLARQVWMLNVAVASQIVASVACAAWLFHARRSVAVRLRAEVARRSQRV